MTLRRELPGPSRKKMEHPKVSERWPLFSSLPETVTIKILVEIIPEKNICPNDVAVVPISGDMYYTFHTVYVR